MLQAIARSGQTNLDEYVALRKIDRSIAENAGRALLKHGLRDGDVETDFLELGCMKVTARP